MPQVPQGVGGHIIQGRVESSQPQFLQNLSDHFHIQSGLTLIDNCAHRGARHADRIVSLRRASEVAEECPERCTLPKR